MRERGAGREEGLVDVEGCTSLGEIGIDAHGSDHDLLCASLLECDMTELDLEASGWSTLRVLTDPEDDPEELAVCGPTSWRSPDSIDDAPASVIWIFNAPDTEDSEISESEPVLECCCSFRLGIAAKDDGGC